MKRYIIMLAAVLAIVLCACGAPSASSGAPASSGTITLQSAWARPVTVGDTTATAEAGAHSGHGSMTATDTAMSGMGSGGMVSAAYMTITNTGSTSDQLLSATTDAAGVVEIHTTITENNVAQMRPVSALDVPANGQVELKPGSYHLMLIDVKRMLQPGDTVPLTLTFQNAGTVEVTAEVRQP